MSTFNQANQNIISTLGIDKLSKEKQQEAMERLGTIVWQEVVLRCIDEMSDPDKESFEKLMGENPTPDKVFEFMSMRVKNIDNIIAEEAESLRAEAVDILEDIK
jgi:hypothetical protein